MPDAVQLYLQRHPLRHILHLKMLAHHGQLVKTTYKREGPDEGALLLFPTTALTYDHQKYGDYELVAMPAADSPRVLNQLLDHVPKTTVVFKLTQESDEALVEKRFAGTRARVFLNYTSAGSTSFIPDPDVVIDAKVNDSLVDVFGRNDYIPTDLARFLENGGKVLSLKEGGRTISAGLVYPNFGNIWEIAGLYTEPPARRRGYSTRIVRAALNYLQQHGYTPRYVVEKTNTPSIKLAQAVGLEHFLSVIHYTAR